MGQPVCRSRLDPERQPAHVAGTARADVERRLAAAVGVDRVLRVARVAGAAPRVRLALEDGVRERVVEVEMTSLDDVAVDVDIDVEVDSAALIPVRVDSLDTDHAFERTKLADAQARSIDIVKDKARVA